MHDDELIPNKMENASSLTQAQENGSWETYEKTEEPRGKSDPIVAFNVIHPAAVNQYSKVKHSSQRSASCYAAQRTKRVEGRKSNSEDISLRAHQI